MYVDVSINTQDEDLFVFIQKCWASPSNGKSLSLEDKQYAFIENGFVLGFISPEDLEGVSY